MFKRWWVVGLVSAILVASLAPLASSFPDGLERVAEDQSFLDLAHGAPFEAIPDYVFPGVPNEALATILAGIVGVLIVFGLTYGLAHLLQHRRADKTLREER